MRLKDCIIGFIVAVLGGVLAGLSFSFIPSRLMAGAVAGAGFVLVGAYLLRVSLKASKPWTWITFYTSIIHLFAISLPMIVVRWLDPSTPFVQMSVWGIPGPQFHLWSMYFYRVLLAGVALDGLRAWLISAQTKKQKPVR